MSDLWKSWELQSVSDAHVWMLGRWSWTACVRGYLRCSICVVKKKRWTFMFWVCVRDIELRQTIPALYLQNCSGFYQPLENWMNVLRQWFLSCWIRQRRLETARFEPPYLLQKNINLSALLKFDIRQISEYEPKRSVSCDFEAIKAMMKRELNKEIITLCSAFSSSCYHQGSRIKTFSLWTNPMSSLW